MDVMDILDKLDEYLSECARLPLVGKLVVDEDEVFNLIDDLRAALPKELEQARWVLKQREEILQDAQKQREDMIKDAQGQIAAIASESVIAREARAQADGLMGKAKEVALEINRGAREYADGVLERIERVLEELLETTRRDRQQLVPEPSEQDTEAAASTGDLSRASEELYEDYEEEDDQGLVAFKRRRRDRVRP